LGWRRKTLWTEGDGGSGEVKVGRFPLKSQGMRASVRSAGLGSGHSKGQSWIIKILEKGDGQRRRDAQHSGRAKKTNRIATRKRNYFEHFSADEGFGKKGELGSTRMQEKKKPSTGKSKLTLRKNRT